MNQEQKKKKGKNHANKNDVNNISTARSKMRTNFSSYLLVFITQNIHRTRFLKIRISYSIFQMLFFHIL